MKPGTNALMLLVIFAIGIAAIAIYLSFCAIAARYMRLATDERDPQLRVSEISRVFLSDDPSMRTAPRKGIRRDAGTQ